MKHPYDESYFKERDINIDISEWKVLREKTIDCSLILEIGCGTGGLLKYLSLNGKRTVGCDISEYAASKAKNRCNFIVICDAQYLPFKHKIFDAAISQHVIEHTQKPKQTIIESIRVSKIKSVHIIPGHPSDDPTHVKNHYKKEEIENFVKDLPYRWVLTDDGKTNPNDLDWLLKIEL